ncbi:MAG: hypothetical protein LLG04_06825 [Parachlamydia sp.]|nr:hypothetical protein [Parachlamydia sp.]
MERVITNLFFHNWSRKLVALLAAIVVWILVSHSITETKTLPNVPVRVIKLPPEKTIQGMLPNGTLTKRITLTVSGSKEIVEELEPGDVEVELDASQIDQDEWIAQIARKNLVSLNPEIDLLHNVTQVNHSEFIIKLSPLMTAKIPITILPPIGEAPPGYEYLDLWPQTLWQLVSGPAEEVERLKQKGLDLTFNLSDITVADLDTIRSTPDNIYDDEIRFIVPSKWKQIDIPFHNYAMEDINDPEAQSLRLYFLRKQTLPIERELPLSAFYPLQTSDTINPGTTIIAPGKYVQIENNIALFKVPLVVKDVSRLFLSTVRNNLEIRLVAAPELEHGNLEWSLIVNAPKELEDIYSAFLVANLASVKSTGAAPFAKEREEVIRKRFRRYLQHLTLYLKNEDKLRLESNVENGKIVVTNY